MKIYCEAQSLILKKRISRINRKIANMEIQLIEIDEWRKELVNQFRDQGISLREKTPESRFVWKLISKINYLEITIPYLKRIVWNLENRLQSLH